jgi:hypothetical protein
LAFLWDDKQAQLPNVEATTADEAWKEYEATDNPLSLPRSIPPIID